VSSGRSGGHVGVCKQGKLSWPWALRRRYFRAERERLDALFARAGTGALDQHTVDDIEAAVSALQARLKSQIKRLDINEHIQSKRFLNQCEDAVRALKQADANDYFTGKYTARGKTVAELVAYMSRHGLRFAPAVAGDEAAYSALHRALAQYSRAVHPVTDRTQLAQRKKPRPAKPRVKRAAGRPPAIPFRWPLPAGRNVVVIRNPNPTTVGIGLRLGAAGRDVYVLPNSVIWVSVPDGTYSIYFVYANEPNGLHQGDNFTVRGNRITITLVRVVGGNYGIRRVR
jgi:hypothetical protein